MLKSLHEIGIAANRDQILAHVASRAPQYNIEPVHADQHVANLQRDGLIEQIAVNRGQPKYRVTSKGKTELGPMAQTPEQPWDDEGRLHDGAPVS